MAFQATRWGRAHPAGAAAPRHHAGFTMSMGGTWRTRGILRRLPSRGGRQSLFLNLDRAVGVRDVLGTAAVPCESIQP